MAEPKTLTFEVTAEDIANGTRYSVSGCPIALALSRALGKPISVGARTAWDHPQLQENLQFWRVTNVMWDWIRRFDLGKPVEPRSFRISV